MHRGPRGRLFRTAVVTSVVGVAGAAAIGAQAPPAGPSPLSGVDTRPRVRLDGPTPPAGGEWWRPRLEIQVGRPCEGCAPTRLGVPPGSPNAPWSVDSTVSFATAGSRVVLGVSGTRNHRLPLFMARTLDGRGDLTAPVGALADLSPRPTLWVVTGSARKVLKRTASGATLGVAGDVFLPLNTTVTPGVPQATVLPSRAVRLGVVLGF